jgi:hypothetical protein
MSCLYGRRPCPKFIARTALHQRQRLQSLATGHLEGPSRGVQRLMEVVCGRTGVAARPEELAGSLAMDAILRRQREQLDEASCLAQPPRVVRHRAGAD